MVDHLRADTRCAIWNERNMRLMRPERLTKQLDRGLSRVQPQLLAWERVSDLGPEALRYVGYHIVPVACPLSFRAATDENAQSSKGEPVFPRLASLFGGA